MLCPAKFSLTLRIEILTLLGKQPCHFHFCFSSKKGVRSKESTFPFHKDLNDQGSKQEVAKVYLLLKIKMSQILLVELL